MVRTLTLSKKTGFMVTEPNTPINIRDDRGIMFYTTEPILPTYVFNLPAGKYIVDSGSFKPMAKPMPFKLESEPMPETAVPVMPVNFKIEFAPNPNKCTIFWPEKMIVFDTKFIDSPYPDIFFIYFHEFGHSKYGFDRLYTPEQAEAFCDLYASNAMLKMGFNPSQIKKTPHDTLSEKQNYRKNFIDEVMLKNAYNYE